MLSVLAEPLDDGAAQPVAEDRQVGDASYRRLEMGLDIPQIAMLATRRFAEVDQVAVWGQIPLLDHRRGGDLKIHLAEERVIVLVLLFVIRIGEGSGQADDPRVGQCLNEFVQDEGPVVEQVVTLIEDNCPCVLGDDALDQITGIGVQESKPVEILPAQELSLDAPVTFGDFAAELFGIGLAQGLNALPSGRFILHLAAGDEVVAPALQRDPLDELQVFAGGGEHLVGEEGHLGQVGGVQAGMLGHPLLGLPLVLVFIEEQGHLLPPLPLDGGSRGEDNGRPPEAAD